MLTLVPGIGATWHFWPPDDDRRFGASLRADCLLVKQYATRFSSGNQRLDFDPRGGADVLIDGEIQLSAGAELVVGFGIEGVFGPTYMDVQGVRTTLASLRALGEAGVRIRF